MQHFEIQRQTGFTFGDFGGEEVQVQILAPLASQLENLHWLAGCAGVCQELFEHGARVQVERKEGAEFGSPPLYHTFPPLHHTFPPSVALYISCTRLLHISAAVRTVKQLYSFLYFFIAMQIAFFQCIHVHACMYIRCNTCVVAQDREAVGVIENKQGAEGQKIGGQVKSLHPQPTAHHPPPHRKLHGGGVCCF